MTPLRRHLAVCFAVVSVCLMAAIALAAVGGVDFSAGLNGRLALLVLIAASGLGAMWIAFVLLDGHLDQLHRLRADIIGLKPADVALPAYWTSAEPEDAGRLAAAVDAALSRRGRKDSLPQQRLAAVVAAIPDGLAVITESGMISLINTAAQALLVHAAGGGTGSGAARVGGSIFAVVRRDDLDAALVEARALGRPLPARLRLIDGSEVEARVAELADHGGAVLTFALSAITSNAALEHDLALHDRLPAAPDLDDALNLADMPAIVFDSETTGLDVDSDRIVALGAVRLHGRRIYHQYCIDCLVNPGRPIPARATEIHGITDAMVADAPDFAEAFRDLATLMRGCVLVGHNIGFDVAILRRECTRAGIAWPDPPTLCTTQLFAALEPAQTDLNLESVADRYGIDVRGRHTALGDALVTADLFVKLQAVLADRGITTLGAASACAASAARLIRQQRRAGW